MKENLRIKIGGQIRQLREREGISQDQLSEMTGIDRSNLSKIECGKYNMSIDLLEKILVALKSDMNIYEQ